MKIKTINSIITNKVKTWLESIDDEELRKEIKDNIIVTGGCITSMLLKEKVNDFDIYFTDLKTTYKVAKYYEKQFYGSDAGIVKICCQSYVDGVWTNIDEKYYDKIIDGNLTDLYHYDFSAKEGINFTDETELRVRFYIQSNGVAGNKETDEEEHIDQYDSYENSLQEGIESIEDLEETVEQNGKYEPTFITDNAITLKGKIQLVLRFYGTPEEIHKNYDFVHCTNYWDSKTGKVHTNTDALEAILAKELKYIGSRYPLASIFRMRKFIQRGWSINVGQILKASLQLNDFDLNNPYVLADQCTGVDVHYLSALIMQITKKIEERKKSGDETPFDVKNYAMTIIEKIFG